MPVTPRPTPAPSANGTRPLDDEGFRAAAKALADADDRFAAVIERHGLPSLWRRPASYASMVLFILEQQVSLASGQAAFARLRARVGEVTPAAVAAVSLQDLLDVGTTRQKAGYVHDLALGIVAGEVDWDAALAGPRPMARRALLDIRGVGPWTADVWLLAVRCLPDEWPIGDRALQVGVGELSGTDPVTGDALVAAAEPWRPHRSSAARLVWHAYLQSRDRVEAQVPGLDPPAT